MVVAHASSTLLGIIAIDVLMDIISSLNVTVSWFWIESMDLIQIKFIIYIWLGCDCNAIGSGNDTCDDYSGQCQCKSNFDGKQCERCKDGYYDYPTCTCKLN